MPKMGDAMEEGTLLKWLKSEGEEVSEGDPIAEIETDKSTVEMESTASGMSFSKRLYITDATSGRSSASLASVSMIDAVVTI